MNESVCVGLVEMGRRWKIYYAVYDVLPYFATADHRIYAKSAYNIST